MFKNNYKKAFFYFTPLSLFIYQTLTFGKLTNMYASEFPSIISGQVIKIRYIITNCLQMCNIIFLFSIVLCYKTGTQLQTVA